MILKEKFKSLNTNFGRDTKYYHHNLKKCEKITDNYAIEFAEWVEEYQGGTPNSKILKELLQLFKKEKGL
jgi:hypothetical protein